MLHLGQWANEETLSIDNPGGFLFLADLEKSNNISESLSCNNQGGFLFQADFEKNMLASMH